MAMWRKDWLGKSLLLAAKVTALAVSCNALADEWSSYGGDPGGTRYSALTQINRDNVSRLQVAWVFHTGDISDGRGGRKRSGFETTPLLVDGMLYITTPFNRVIALDPETGKQRWAYDPQTQLSWDYGDGLINRGVAIWSAPNPRESGKPTPCARRRIFEATLDARLIALDAITGAPCPDFGQGGQVSLRDVARYMPQGMQDVGTGMHRAASRFAIEATNAAATGDARKPLATLAEVTSQCVACHAAYRLE